ncbi:S-adenosyl-L-methionine-dependent methyltransferase [Thamnidium elegans]|nr:S-adenosyl-L-methionine-dependent methyltransferase [Thamnidium elegans]
MGNMSSRENQDGKSVKTRSSISRFSSTGSLHTWSKSLDKRKKHKQSSASILKEQSSCSTLYEDSVHEIPLIEKYTDSQMTLLSNKSQQVSQVDHITTISSTSTTSTHISENQADIVRDYSSQSMLKELYMLCETSPERRRDRDRRHRQHYLLKRTWGSNFKVPLHNPKLIIDWCCSSAVWDIEIALQFPNAKVIGIDYESATVSSITSTVKNFSFQNAMIHLGETGLKKFKDNQVDYIIMRDVYLVNSPVTKWVSLFKEIYRILKPGGYIEIYEQDVTYRSIGPYLTIMEEWADRLYEAIKIDRNTNNQLGSFLQDTGYVNIQHEHKDLPIGEWPADQELKETGYLQRDLTERKFREAKRWMCKFNSVSEQEYSRVLSKAIDECDDYNTSLRSLYFSAQKPT